MKSFEERFGEFADEAQQELDAAKKNLEGILAQADAVLQSIRNMGLDCRIEMPYSAQEFSQIRLSASFSKTLKSK